MVEYDLRENFQLVLNKMNSYIALSWDWAQSPGLIKTLGEKQKTTNSQINQCFAGNLSESP
jgi:hypothetical protein